MRILEHNGQVLSVAFFANGQAILTNTLEGGTFLWETRSGKVVTGFRQAAIETLFALFSPNGQSIFSPGLAHGEATIYGIASAMSGDCGRRWEHSALRFLVMVRPCSSGEKTENKASSRCSGLRRAASTYV